jgi:hypothetical protein
MRRLALALAGCSFHTSDAPAGDAPPVLDAAVDGAAPRSVCAPDPAVRMCFSFDQEPLPAMLPDEGAAIVDAQLTDVIGSGGAAVLGATSEIFVPMVAEISGIRSIEIRFRLDTDPSDGNRSGLLDSNISPPNISLFINRVGDTHNFRCGIGAETTSWDAPVTIGTWIYAACICNGTNQQMYVDGVRVGDTPGACASGGALVADGLTIGSNNNGGPNGIDAQLLGAIDWIRLSTVAPTPDAICATAGKTGCGS